MTKTERERERDERRNRIVDGFFHFASSFPRETRSSGEFYDIKGRDQQKPTLEYGQRSILVASGQFPGENVICSDSSRDVLKGWTSPCHHHTHTSISQSKAMCERDITRITIVKDPFATTTQSSIFEYNDAQQTLYELNLNTQIHNNWWNMFKDKNYQLWCDTC